MAPEWTSSPAPSWPAPTLWALLARRASAIPQAPALLAPAAAGGPQTWHACDLFAAAQALAVRLTEQGVGPGDRVAWLGLNHPFALVMLFALARIGALWVPLNHRLAPAEWAAVLADCEPKVLYHDAVLAEAARALARPRGLPACGVPEPFGPDGVMAALSSDAPTLPEIAPALAPVLLVYTSGTTGAPKAAVHTQAHLLANMAMAAQVQQLSAADTVLSVLPLFHVGGLCIQTLPALAVGARVLLHERFEPGAVLSALETDRPTLTLQVPATLQALIQHPRWPEADLSSLRAVWAGSSLLPEATLQAFHARGVPVCNVYGSTETGPFSIALPPEHAASHLGACGWPAPGVAVKLCDPQGRPVAPGAVGEVCLRAPNVVAHYWPDRPAQDAEGFFHSGDLARQAPDGSYTVVGRAKDMIISGGENIYPAEVENLLGGHPAVAECCVIGQSDARWGEVVVAVVVLREPAAGGDWSAPLLAWLDGRLARYKWPRRWVRLDGLPRTALGKVQKAELRRQLDVGA